jgi:hypothetical protein
VARPVARRYSLSILVATVLLAGCASPGASAPGASGPAGTPSNGPQGAPATEKPSPTTVDATPAITGLTGHVVFARAGGQYGDETTFVMNIDGSDLHQIGELARSGFPFVANGGSRIVVGTESPPGHLGSLIFDLDGGNRYEVPQTDGLMFGSAPPTPDGKFLVAETFTTAFEFQAMNVISIATGKMRTLVDDKHYISGDVSPDGKQVLLFLNNPDVDPPAPGQLWVINLDGTNLHQLTPSGSVVQCCMNYKWSPDGKTVIFASPAGGLWTIGADGSNLTEVFHQDGKWAITPCWSPDGSMIMFALDPTDNPFQHPVNELDVIRADGSDLTVIFKSDYFKREPIWLP